MLKSKKEVSLRSYKELERKVNKLDEKSKTISKELSEKRAECRELRKDINRISESRDRWKSETIELRYSCKLLKIKCLEQSEALKPKGHQYPTWLITLVVILRIYCNCSYGSIEKILTTLGEDYEFGNIKEEGVPCKNTLQNWVSKVGFFYLQKSDNQLFNNGIGQNSEDLCLIIDESVRVGTEKLLLAIVLDFGQNLKTLN